MLENIVLNATVGKSPMRGRLAATYSVEDDIVTHSVDIGFHEIIMYSFGYSTILYSPKEKQGLPAAYCEC